MVALGMLFAQSIDFTPEETAFAVVSDMPGKLDIRLEIDAMNIGEITIEGSKYNTISIGDWGRLTKEGYPALPQFGKRIAVPAKASVSIEMTNVKRRVIQNITPFPAQPPAIDEVGAKSPPFTVNRSYYDHGGVYPEQSAWEQERGTVRSVEMALIRFAPVSWDASTRELTVIESCDIAIHYSTGTIYDERLHSRWFDSLFYQRVLNRNQLSPASSNTRSRDTGCDLLIVTSYEMEEAAELLRAWKQKMGYITDVAYIEDIDNLENYLEEVYDTWDIPPSFAIFLGDAEIIDCDHVNSAISYDNVGTDLTYFCMDGYNDYYPDIASGRVSVDTAEQAMTVVGKMIQYEADPPELASFYESATVCAYFQDDSDNGWIDGYEDRRFVKTSEEVRDWMLDEGYTVERIYCTPSDRVPTNYNDGYYANGEPLPDELLRENGFQWDGDDADIANAINDGVFIVNHRDHGISRNYTYESGSDPSFDGWGDPYFDSWQVQALHNGNLLPFVFSINCQTGWFDGETDYDPSKSYESFCEEFIRNENGGAVGAYGASRSSLSGYNDYFVRGYFDSMWEHFMPNYQYMESGGSTTLMMITGLMAMEEFWEQDNYSEYEFYIFHNFCDPTLRIWRQQPEELAVEHPSTLELTAVNIPITVSEVGGIATCIFDDAIVGRAEITENSFTLTLDEAIEFPGTATVTVNIRDNLIYEGEIEFIQPSAGFVLIDSLIVSDISGNDDGEWDAGEELNLQFFYRNAGTLASDPVTAVISPDEFIDLDIESMQIDETVPGEIGFFETTGTLSMQCDDGQNVIITITIENDTGTFEHQYEIPAVFLPKLVCETDSVYTQLDQPSQSQIPVTLENIGAAPLEIEVINYSNQAADLTASDAYIMAPSTAGFDNLNEMTIMLWFNIPDGFTPGYLLYKGESFINRSFQIALPNMNSLNYAVLTSTGVNASRNLAYNFEADHWYHFAVTVSEDGMKSYLDGILMGEDEFTPPIRYNEDAFFFGCAMNGVYEFNGYMDGLTFFSRELSAVEIVEKSCLILPNQEIGLIGYYPFDEDTGSMNVVTGVEGTLVGDTTFDTVGAPISTWLYCNPSTIEIPGYSNVELYLNFMPEAYQAGLYESHIELRSNSSYESSIDIPVTLYYTYYSIGDEPQPEQDFQISLLSNPFTPGIRAGGFRFDLPEPMNVEITLYNIKGQRVRKLVSELKPQGTHSVTWDGCDQAGKNVGSGVYLARIVAGKHRATRKMMLIR